MALAQPSEPHRILHVINSLETGGTELALLRLIAAERSWGWEPAVISLAAGGRWRSAVAELGVPVFSLGMRLNAPLAAHLRYLLHVPAIVPLVWRLRPHLIQGWLAHSNLAASIAAMSLPRRTPVIWNIRQAFYGHADDRATTAMLIRAARWVSRHPAAIVYNSRLGARQHEALGYCAARTTVIAGGIDCARFHPDPAQRSALRRELGLDDDAVLVGLVARYHSIKDHATFLAAAAELAPRYENLFFVLVGQGATPDSPDLVQTVARLGLGGRIFLLGERSDVERLDAAFDIACSSSRAEAFCNAIAEAMASGVPCVATDVGDSALIVGDTGAVVPASDPRAFAGAIARLIDLGASGRERLGAAARRRIESEFSATTQAARYRDLSERHLRAGSRGAMVGLAP